MPRIRFSIAALMLFTLAAAIVVCFAARLDNNIREFRRSIESGDLEVVNQMISDSGHALRSQPYQIRISQIQARLLDFLFFKRTIHVKFSTGSMVRGTSTFEIFHNESNFTVGPFGTEFKHHAETLVGTFT